MHVMTYEAAPALATTPQIRSDQIRLRAHLGTTPPAWRLSAGRRTATSWGSARNRTHTHGTPIQCPGLHSPSESVPERAFWVDKGAPAVSVCGGGCFLWASHHAWPEGGGCLLLLPACCAHTHLGPVLGEHDQVGAGHVKGLQGGAEAAVAPRVRRVGKREHAPQADPAHAAMQCSAGTRRTSTGFIRWAGLWSCAGRCQAQLRSSKQQCNSGLHPSRAENATQCTQNAVHGL